MKVLVILCCCFSFQSIRAQSSAAVTFVNTIGSAPLMPDSTYFNDFGEDFSISKLRYYVSGLRFETDGQAKESSTVFLVDFTKENVFTVPLPGNKITGISFLLGVDSALNCSGAQSNALDPLNDMFWTWNSGYVMFKLEGNSSLAKTDQRRIEHHVGGYKGPYKAMRPIYLPLEAMPAKSKMNVEISLDLNKYWNGKNKMPVAENPLITNSGIASASAADNFPGMFSVKVLP